MLDYNLKNSNKAHILKSNTRGGCALSIAWAPGLIIAKDDTACLPERPVFSGSLLENNWWKC